MKHPFILALMCLAFITVNACGSPASSAPKPTPDILPSPTPSAGEGITVTVNGKTFTEAEIRAAIACYRNSANVSAQGIAASYERQLALSADNENAFETQLTAMAGHFLEHQSDFNLSCLDGG